MAVSLVALGLAVGLTLGIACGFVLGVWRGAEGLGYPFRHILTGLTAMAGVLGIGLGVRDGLRNNGEAKHD